MTNTTTEPTATVTLRRDQWPAILFALDHVAEAKKKEYRDLAEAVLRELRMEIISQIESAECAAKTEATA